MKKKDDYLISIIVPIYNMEKYLNKCIDSIINQTYKNIEVLLINDGSKDNSEKIIKTYKDKRIKYYLNKNQGIGKTRNFGIKESSGDYIMFVDSDDYLELNACEVLLKKAIDDNLDEVVCNYYRDFGTEKTKDIVKHFGNTSLKDNPKLINIINRSPWNKIYKSELIKQNNIIFLEDKKYEDTPFFADTLIHASKIGIVDDYLYNYVIHSKSETTIRDRRCFDIFDVLDIMRNQFKDLDYMKEELDKLTVDIVVNYTIQQRVQENKEIVNEFIDKAFEYLKENVKDYKNKKYYENKNIFRRKIESNKQLTKTYCKIARVKYKRK